ncbi:hypothetical protein VTL71DRAFT_3442 [Oculimacula yallundae]|uniref:Xylanolytic transcriptional activator regulatory domain-containing protein n=1 Tax=Oculimacula yallundae TaxID=86028 RepID=A0ABR4C7Z3_9HELO
MDIDDFNQLTEFIFDHSTPESGEEDNQEPQIEKDCDATNAHDVAPNGRVIRRRARKACVACHKRKRVRLKPPERVTETQNDVGGNVGVSSSQVDIPALSQNVSSGGQSRPVIGNNFQSGLNPFSNFSSNPSSLHPDMIYSYFDFIEAETFSHIAPEDFKFLEFKGCFHLPSRPILDDLVREYFLHVHPVLPIIDERAFWELYFPRDDNKRRSTDQKIPLFVFRAMLFVSCGFVSNDTARQMGFQTVVEARTCFYRRAKLLYDFDTTSNSIANSSWLRLAIQFANSANVAMYDQDSTISADERLNRKRLWWCIVLRDRILPLGVRRSIQITRANFDFNLPRLTEKDLEPECTSSCVYDAETKRDLIRVFLAQLDLAVELTDALSYVYPANGFRSFDILDYNEVMSMPKKIEMYLENLESWHTRFNEWVVPGAFSKKHKSVMLYSGLTSIYFQSAKAALCQLESFMLQADDSKQHDTRMNQLGSALHMSVASISETTRAFIQLDVAKYLPVSMVAYLALPIILNSMDLQNLSSTNARAEGKRRQLRLLNEAMDLCNDRYTGTLAARNIIKKSIEVARSEQNVIKDKASMSNSLTRATPDLQDWLDVFVSSPAAFLRISFSTDMSLAEGRYPTTADLPRQLSLQGRLIPSRSIPRTLMPAEEDPIKGLADVDATTTLEPNRNSYLDYFDFGQSQAETKPDTSSWAGKDADKIMEEVLSGGEKFWSTDPV